MKENQKESPPPDTDLILHIQTLMDPAPRMAREKKRRNILLSCTSIYLFLLCILFYLSNIELSSVEMKHSDEIKASSGATEKLCRFLLNKLRRLSSSLDFEKAIFSDSLNHYLETNEKNHWMVLQSLNEQLGRLNSKKQRDLNFIRQRLQKEIQQTDKHFTQSIFFYPLRKVTQTIEDKQQDGRDLFARF
ncbi:hypothetical protein ACFL35_15065 [Candidatus Riflebacteria bacterium]